MRILLKGCSRCAGDMTYDRHEDSLSCLQCGWEVSRERWLRKPVSMVASRPLVAAAIATSMPLKLTA